MAFEQDVIARLLLFFEDHVEAGLPPPRRKAKIQKEDQEP
jgi:hypothetical protein